MALHRFLRSENHRRSAVVHARGIARGNSSGVVQGLEFGEGLQSCIRTDVFVLSHDGGYVFHTHFDGHDLFRQEPVRRSLGGALLAAKGEGILLLSLIHI